MAFGRSQMRVSSLAANSMYRVATAAEIPTHWSCILFCVWSVWNEGISVEVE